MRPSRWVPAVAAILGLLASGSVAVASCVDGDTDTYCDIPVQLLFARITRNLKPLPRAKIILEGEFFTQPGDGDVFDASADISFRVTEADHIDMTFLLPTSSCITLITGRIRCIDSTGTVRGLFIPISGSPNIFHFRLKAARLDIGGPYAPPVTLTITHDDGSNRRGVMDECRNSKKGMSCKAL